MSDELGTILRHHMMSNPMRQKSILAQPSVESSRLSWADQTSSPAF